MSWAGGADAALAASIFHYKEISDSGIKGIFAYARGRGENLNFINMNLEVDFEKYADGLAPAIVQDSVTDKVLMLGFMNREALDQTQAEGKVTFYSRSRKSYGPKVRRAGISVGEGHCGRL